MRIVEMHKQALIHTLNAVNVKSKVQTLFGRILVKQIIHALNIKKLLSILFFFSFNFTKTLLIHE